MKQSNRVLNLKKSLPLSLAAMTILSVGCSKVSEFSHKKEVITVTSSQGAVNQLIGEGSAKMKVMSASVLAEQIKAGKIHSATSLAAKNKLASLPQGEESAARASDEPTEPNQSNEDSLLVAMPIGLIGQQNMFGGVITKITDKTSETLGGLKLTDLSPIHVQGFVTGIQQGEPALTLFGCVSKCTETSKSSALINIPIVGVDDATDSVILDLAPLGQELDLLSMLDEDGEYTGLKAIASTATYMSYNLSTLVFDVKSTFVPKDQVENPEAPKTDVTVRWYLKLTSGSNPSFISRSPRPEAGFFTTERSADTKITRWNFNGPQNGQVKYYIKQVPKEYQGSFKKALDSWNEKFKPLIGKNLFSYEFVAADDPRNKDLVPGDIRYNIIEWDLDNKAGYGGLGPSIANQFSGETMSANVLVQGPTIVGLYSEWFKVNEAADALAEQGKFEAAERLFVNFNKKANNVVASRNQKKFSVKLGNLAFNVRSQTEQLEDPLTKGSFEKVPAGYTYQKYMDGYFLEMVAHELGHNLGLRHNFRGNLASKSDGTDGSTSNSIMEYLGREYRYLNRIQKYDEMAIAFGYQGVAPTHADWFCTDDHVSYDETDAATASAECSKADATKDPFSYFEARLARGIGMLVNDKTTGAPVWKLAEMPQIGDAITGLTNYAASAEATADKWTNFFGKEGRPADKKGVKAYVLASIKKQLCSKQLAETIGAKESEEAKALASQNIKDLQAAVAKRAQALSIFSAQELECQVE